MNQMTLGSANYLADAIVSLDMGQIALGISGDNLSRYLLKGVLC